MNHLVHFVRNGIFVAIVRMGEIVTKKMALQSKLAIIDGRSAELAERNERENTKLIRMDQRIRLAMIRNERIGRHHPISIPFSVEDLFVSVLLDEAQRLSARRKEKQPKEERKKNEITISFK